MIYLGELLKGNLAETLRQRGVVVSIGGGPLSGLRVIPEPFFISPHAFMSTGFIHE
jgi:hypothetical protein